MKKVLLTLTAALVVTTAANAQEEAREVGTTTKKGSNILPYAGDIAIGFEANPFLKYAGNLFTDANNTAPSFDGREGVLFGKYFLTDKTAVRARLGFNFGSTKKTTEVNSAYKANEKVLNTETTKLNNLELGVGYEMRRGYGRLQGFYGGEVVIGTIGEKKDYTWGNNLSATYAPGARTLQQDISKGFNFGIGGFAGVEYFVAPKISLGGELGLYINTNNSKGGKTVTEHWDAVNQTIETTTIDASKNKTNNFNFGTATRDAVNLTFHF